MILRYGFMGLGAYLIVSGILHRSFFVVVLGGILLLVAAGLFQAQRVAKKWRDEADRISPSRGE